MPSVLSLRCPPTSAFANTRVEWKETPEAHLLKADLPGVKKEEVEEGERVLQISGERHKEEKRDKWHRMERRGGKFPRRFRLSENARVDQVKVFDMKYEDVICV
ncbi:17.6 kDa class I heat shock protein-like [Musa acuminata AAA Group]|uniref:17.6 kDa class I heat shock protein-like n=1 Tax=Musa acuminata AAA Group TaxID=214697 RepID=UPI0031D89DE6